MQNQKLCQTVPNCANCAELSKCIPLNKRKTYQHPGFRPRSLPQSPRSWRAGGEGFASSQEGVGYLFSNLGGITKPNPLGHIYFF